MKTKKLTKLEAVRGFAAFYVIFHHSFKNLTLFGLDLSILLRFGQEAVILFFILSGFVIEYSFNKLTDKSFKSYFFKRFFRIYIPVVIVYLLSYFMTSGRFSIQTLLGNLFMLQDMSFVKPNTLVSPLFGNSPLWSLSYEWWFYMLYFPLVTYFRKYDSVIVFGLGVLSALTYLYYPNFLNRELMYMVIWWSGVIMARHFEDGISFNNTKYALMVISVIALILFFNVLIKYKKLDIGLHPILEFRHFAFAVVAIVLALLWQKINWIGFNRSIGLFAKIAPISFGIYITHYFLISHAKYLDDFIRVSFLRYVVYFAVCFIVSYLIERVIYVHVNRYIRSRTLNKF